MAQAGARNGESALQVGGGAVEPASGMIESIGLPVINSRALKGWLALRRCARLSWRSLRIPTAARTDQVPLPLGSQATPTRGCSSALALFFKNGERPIRGLVCRIPFA